jgi:hypothetical protein
MTAVTSYAPGYGELEHPPGGWMEFVCVPSGGETLRPLDPSATLSLRVEFYGVVSVRVVEYGVLTAAGVSAGWEVAGGSTVGSLAYTGAAGIDDPMTVRVRPVGGWAPESNYGNFPTPPGKTETGTVIAFIDCTDTGGGSLYLGSTPLFSTSAVAAEPWTYAELPADTLAQISSDQPVVSGRNLLLGGPELVWSDTGAWAVVPVQNPYRPTSRLADEAGTPGSAPMSSAATSYILIDCGSPLTFDCIAILGNFPDLDTCPRIAVEIASDDQYASDLQVIAEWTAGISRRVASVTLGQGLHTPVLTTGAAYSARWIRVVIEYTGPTSPSVGEVFFARMWSPPGAPLLPVEIDAEVSEFSTWEALDGTERQLAISRRRAQLSLSWPLLSDSSRASARTWVQSVQSGARSFLVWAAPSSAPNRPWLVRCPEMSVTPHTGPVDSTITVDVVEQAPFLGLEE